MKVGDEIAENDSLVLLESDKASVEVPSTATGTVVSIAIKEGDTVQEGVVLLKLKTAGGASAAPEQAPAASSTNAPAKESAAETAQPATESNAPAGDVEVNVPDLGVDKAAVAEILVKVGDKITKDESIVVVESDKATVEVPSSVSGVVKAVHVQAGQDVQEGVLLITVEAEGAAPSAPKAAPAKAEAAPAPAAPKQRLRLLPKPIMQRHRQAKTVN